MKSAIVYSETRRYCGFFCEISKSCYSFFPGFETLLNMKIAISKEAKECIKKHFVTVTNHVYLT